MKAIDVHSHFGDAGGFPQQGKEKEFLALSAEDLERICQEQNIAKMFVSPTEGIFPFGEHTVVSANEQMERLVMTIPWMYQWVIIHPEVPETFLQAERMLGGSKCVGIKIHPDAHGYRISDYGNRIFEFAARHDAVIESHSGGMYSVPEDFVEFADRFAEVRVLLSHLGNSCDGDVGHHVRALQQCRHGNLYTDVSSVKSILFHLVEWAVSEVGVERILFGTDSPLHHIGMMKSRIEFGGLKEEEKESILYKNAERLFKLK